MEPPLNFYEIPGRRYSSFSDKDSISDKFRDFDSGLLFYYPVLLNFLEDEAPGYSSYMGQTGVPTIPSYTSTTSPIGRITVCFFQKMFNFFFRFKNT